MEEETIRTVNEQELRKMFREKEPFKIKVTPELSRRIQEIGFEEGVKWAEGTKEVGHTEEPGLFFNIDHKFTYFYEIGSYFSSQKEQEICFIETKEEKSFFSSQQEIWKYLSEEEGRKVIHTRDAMQIVGFKEGNLYNFAENRQSYIDFATHYLWKPYIEKETKPWYESIPEQGVLCWVNYSDEEKKNKIALIIKAEVYAEYISYSTEDCLSYAKATPLTAEEVEQYILKGE